MKKHFFLLCLAAALMAAAALTSYKSAPNTGTGHSSGFAAQAKNQAVQLVCFDYQGAANGSDMPAWAESLLNSELKDAIKKNRFNSFQQMSNQEESK